MKLVKNENQKNVETVSDKEAEEAFIKILRWIGEDPMREGLLETPRRVTKAFKEYFEGYKDNPASYLGKTFTEVEGYDDMVIEKNISIRSHCEHHMAPIVGVAHVAYIPAKKVVGLSKLARVVEAFSKRLPATAHIWGRILKRDSSLLASRHQQRVLGEGDLLGNQRPPLRLREVQKEGLVEAPDLHKSSQAKGRLLVARTHTAQHPAAPTYALL